MDTHNTQPLSAPARAPHKPTTPDDPDDANHQKGPVPWKSASRARAIAALAPNTSPRWANQTKSPDQYSGAYPVPPQGTTVRSPVRSSTTAKFWAVMSPGQQSVKVTL